MLLTATMQALADNLGDWLGYALTLAGFLIATLIMIGFAYLIGFTVSAAVRRLRHLMTRSGVATDRTATAVESSYRA